MRGALFVLLGVVSLCSGAIIGCVVQPDRFYQVCFTSEEDISNFKREIENLAHTSGLKFIDDSEAVTAQNKRLANRLPSMPFQTPATSVGVRGRNVWFLTAVSFNDAWWQVHIALFSFGSEKSRAERFANEAVQKLGAVWKLHPVPQDKGAFPLPECLEPKRT